MWVCLASVHFAHQQIRQHSATHTKTGRRSVSTLLSGDSTTSHFQMCCKYFTAVQGSVLTVTWPPPNICTWERWKRRVWNQQPSPVTFGSTCWKFAPEQKHRQRTYNIKQSCGCYSAGAPVRAEEHAQQWNQAKLKSIAVHLYSTEAFINLYWTMTHSYCP